MFDNFDDSSVNYFNKKQINFLLTESIQQRRHRCYFKYKDNLVFIFPSR